MKHQQVVVDYVQMFKTSVICLLLALFGFMLMRFVHIIFWLPRYLERNQKGLEELAKRYDLDFKKDVPFQDPSTLDSQPLQDTEPVEEKKEK